MAPQDLPLKALRRRHPPEQGGAAAGQERCRPGQAIPLGHLGRQDRPFTGDVVGIGFEVAVDGEVLEVQRVDGPRRGSGAGPGQEVPALQRDQDLSGHRPVGLAQEVAVVPEDLVAQDRAELPAQAAGDVQVEGADAGGHGLHPGGHGGQGPHGSGIDLDRRREPPGRPRMALRRQHATAGILQPGVVGVGARLLLQERDQSSLLPGRPEVLVRDRSVPRGGRLGRIHLVDRYSAQEQGHSTLGTQLPHPGQIPFVTILHQADFSRKNRGSEVADGPPCRPLGRRVPANEIRKPAVERQIFQAHPDPLRNRIPPRILQFVDAEPQELVVPSVVHDRIRAEDLQTFNQEIRLQT